MNYNRRQILKRGSATAIGTSLLAGCNSITGGGEEGEEYPEQPIEMVIPFSQGGGTDITNRFLADHIGNELGTDIVIENIEGAASLRGTQEVVQNREPDGYTILAFNPPSTPISYLVHEPDFDIQSLEGIATYAITPHLVNVNTNTANDYGIENYDDLTEAYQEGQLDTFAGQSLGSYFHVLALTLRNKTGLEFTNYVGYDGTGPTVEAVASGEAPAGIGNDVASVAFEEDDLLIPIVMLTTEGSNIYPDMDDLTDFGYEQMDFLGQVTRCYWAPPDTPQERLDTLTNAVESTLEKEEVIQWAEEEGHQLNFGNQEDANQVLNDVLERIPEEVDLESIRQEVD